jgi:hypothetical protein
MILRHFSLTLYGKTICIVDIKAASLQYVHNALCLRVLIVHISFHSETIHSKKENYYQYHKE